MEEGFVMRSLSEAKAGERCEIKWMLGIPEFLEFLRIRGVEVGTTVSVIQNRAGSLIIGTGTRRIALSGEVAARIKV